MDAPTVTIGLPVRNGAALLDHAIDALVRQTRRDLRILISDNCSTDATPAISSAWAERDPRIEYVRQPRTLSALQHFRYVYEQCRTPYFMWAAHDDLRSENFVAALVAALEAHPEASIAFGDLVNFTDLQSMKQQAVTPYEFANEGLSHTQRAVRALLLGGAELYGVIRSECLRGYGWYDIDYASDAPISTHLALRGDFIYVAGAVFYQWIAPTLKTPAERSAQESLRPLKPLRWVRLVWTCVTAAASARGANRLTSRVLTFTYLYLRVRPVKLRAEFFAAAPPPAQHFLRHLAKMLRRSRHAEISTAREQPR